MNYILLVVIVLPQWWPEMGEVSQEHFCIVVTIIFTQSKRNGWFLKLSPLMAFFIYDIYAYENLGAFLFGFIYLTKWRFTRIGALTLLDSALYISGHCLIQKPVVVSTVLYVCETYTVSDSHTWSLQLTMWIKEWGPPLFPTYKNDLECDLEFHNMITNEP